jgi:hypothetical protein
LEALEEAAMKRLMKFLLGLTVGAAVAMLLAPKSGRELRQQLIGGAGGKLLPAAPDEFAQPDAEKAWDTGGVATAVAEPEAIAEAPVAEEPVVEELVVEEIAVAEVAVDEPGVEEVIAVAETVSVSDDGVVTDTVVTTDTTVWAAPEEEAPAVEPGADEVSEPVAEAAREPVAEESPEPVAEAVVGEDLRPRIEETRADVESDIARPFADEASPAAEPTLEGPVYQAPAPEPEAAPAEVAEEEAPPSAAPAPVPHGWDIPYGTDEPQVAPEIAAEEPPAELEAEATSTGGTIEEAAPQTASGLVADTAAILEPVVQPDAEPQAEPEPVALAEPEAVVEPELVTEPELVVEPEPSPAAEEAPEAAREGSGNIDQAEMRQRIEETRARLKAKAFDAMMSGEAALLSRDSGEKPVPTADDIKLDNDVESTIDESLSQEDA